MRLPTLHPCPSPFERVALDADRNMWEKTTPLSVFPGHGPREVPPTWEVRSFARPGLSRFRPFTGGRLSPAWPSHLTSTPPRHLVSTSMALSGFNVNRRFDSNSADNTRTALLMLAGVPDIFLRSNPPEWMEEPVMMDEQTEFNADSNEDGASGDSESESEASGAASAEARQRSTIAFPYNALEDAGELAHAIQRNAGTAECSDAQLAAWLKMSPKSSTMRVRIASARIFGLVEPGNSDDHVLTDLGKKYVDDLRNKEARVQAFLNVPLYGAIFDHYDGGVIPPAAALERQIASFGVAEKQKGRARAAFEKSAHYAGFHEHGSNRLVKPGLQAVGKVDRSGEGSQREQGGDDGGGRVGFDHDPMIVGLFKRLPQPEDAWTLQERKRWLQTAAQIFDLIYGDDEEGEISVTLTPNPNSTTP